MGRSSFGQVVWRILAVVGALLLVGIFLRLIAAILRPVLPGILWRDLGTGWNMLYEMVAPAMPAAMAVLILATVCWVVIGRWR